MKLLIDALNDNTDWIVSGATVTNVDWNEISKNYITGQLQFEFNDNGTAEKTFASAIDISEYKYLVFSKCELRKETEVRFKVYENANFTEFIVNFKANKSYYEFPVLYDTITKIEFEAVQETKVILSGLYAYKEELPYDLNEGILETVEYIINNEITLPLIGSASGTSGDSTLTITGDPKFVRRFGIIKVGNDIYQIKDIQPGTNQYTLRFTGQYSGETLINTYSGTSVYFYPTVLNNPTDIDSNMPALFLVGDFTPGHDDRYSQEKTDTYAIDTNNKTYERGVNGLSIYRPVLHGFYSSNEIKQLLTNVLTKIQSYRVFYFNGKRHISNSISFSELPLEDGKGNLQLTLEIHLENYTWQRTTNPFSQNQTVAVTPQAEV